MKFLVGYPGIFFVCALGTILVTRRLLFGLNSYRPNPAIGLPDRIAPRMDYQNVIPIYGEKMWFTKRLEAYVDLQCSIILDVVVGWSLAIQISVPYFLFQ